MYLRNFFKLQAPEELSGEGAGFSDGNDIVAPDLSFPSDQELMSDGLEIDNGDGIQNEPTDDGQGESKQEDMEHRDEMTEQQMLDELAREDETKEGEGTEGTESEEEFKIPEDFKDVLKRGDELHSVGYNEMKELAQKGYDYTQKTQEVANERKELEETFTQKEQELSKAYEVLKEDATKHQNVLDEYNKFEYALQMMKEKDPDLLEHISEYANEAQRVLDNPVNRGLRNQISKLEETVQNIQSESANANTREKNDLLLKGFNTDLEKVKTGYADTLKKVGLAPDWEKVKEAWINGEERGTSVETALFEVYGPQITKLFQSKMQVRQAAAKIGKQPTVSSRNKIPRAKVPKKTDWGAFEEDLYNQIQSGTLEI